MKSTKFPEKNIFVKLLGSKKPQSVPHRKRLPIQFRQTIP